MGGNAMARWGWCQIQPLLVQCPPHLNSTVLGGPPKKWGKGAAQPAGRQRTPQQGKCGGVFSALLWGGGDFGQGRGPEFHPRKESTRFWGALSWGGAPLPPSIAGPGLAAAFRSCRKLWVEDFFPPRAGWSPRRGGSRDVAQCRLFVCGREAPGKPPSADFGPPHPAFGQRGKGLLGTKVTLAVPGPLQHPRAEYSGKTPPNCPLCAPKSDFFPPSPNISFPKMQLQKSPTPKNNSSPPKNASFSPKSSFTSPNVTPHPKEEFLTPKALTPLKNKSPPSKLFFPLPNYFSPQNFCKCLLLPQKASSLPTAASPPKSD